MKNLTDFLKSVETGVDPCLRYYRNYTVRLPFSFGKKKTEQNKTKNNCRRKINEFEESSRFESTLIEKRRLFLMTCFFFSLSTLVLQYLFTVLFRGDEMIPSCSISVNKVCIELYYDDCEATREATMVQAPTKGRKISAKRTNRCRRGE